MTNDQQSEALDYFKSHAEEWNQKAKTLSKAKFNVIQTRNDFVLEVIKERKETRHVLDVGCGTGDLVCEIARSGLSAVGVDFAADMIDAAVKTAESEGLSKASFERCSIFEYQFPEHPFDTISANGFIEYISQDELMNFIDLAAGALAPGGSFVVGSRNRLFNMFTLNTFTQMEIDSAGMEDLMYESIALASGGTLWQLSEIGSAPLQNPDTMHENTGIEVTTRYQYTPLQLLHLLADKGLKVIEIYPVHIHGVPPVFKDTYPEVHTSIANLLQSYARHRMDLVPSASTFMIHAVKGELE